MKARSPENGFDEIRELFKDDESTVLDGFDLGFFINRDLGPGYLFDDLITGYDSYNNIQVNEEQGAGQQPELPSLPLSFGDYDIPGPSSTKDDLISTAESGFHAEVLPDSDVFQDQNIASGQDKENIDRSCGFQVQADVKIVDLDHEVQNFVMLDDDQGVNKVDGTDEIVDETCFDAIQEKMNDFESCFTQDNEATSIINDSENVQQDANEETNNRVDIDENQTDDKSGSVEMSLCTPQSLDDQEYSVPYSLLNISYTDMSLVQTDQQDECFDQNQETLKCREVRRSASPFHGSKNSELRCRTSRKREREVAGSSSCNGETKYKKSADSSDSQHHKRIRKSVSPPPNRRHNRYNEHRRERNRSRSRSPCGRDYHRIRYSQRKRSPSRSHSSRHRSPRTRYSPPAFFRGTGLGKPGTCLFVAGLCFSLSERELARKFSRFGRIRDVRIIRDKRSGRSRGYGFLSLERSEEADAAIRAIHRTEWNGRMILVEKSIPS